LKDVTTDTDPPAAPVGLVDSSFDVALWGYHRTQVRRCLAELQQQLAELIAERDRVAELTERLTAAEQEAATLRARLAGVPPAVHQVGTQVQGIMQMAEREAAEVREAAYAELAAARAERARANAEATELRERLAREATEARRDCETVLAEFRRNQRAAASAVLADAYRRAREMVTRR
jgi:cell division septum initiation protein DivIVA